MLFLALTFIVLGSMGCDPDGGAGDAEGADSGMDADAGDGDTGEDGADCQAQDEVNQTLFIGEPESVVLVDVPEGWTPDRYPMQVGFDVAAPSESGDSRPNLSVTNVGRFDRSVVDIITQDLESVGSVEIHGEDVGLFLQGNQPTWGVNLEAYAPTAPGSEDLMHVTVLTRFIGSNDDQERCQDSLRDLAVLVGESLRENPDWAG